MNSEYEMSGAQVEWVNIFSKARAKLRTLIDGCNDEHSFAILVDAAETLSECDPGYCPHCARHGEEGEEMEEEMLEDELPVDGEEESDEPDDNDGDIPVPQPRKK